MSTFLTVERARELPALAQVAEGYLAHLVAAACEAAERYCKRRFALTTYTGEAYRGDGGATLFLRNFPVTELQSVIIVEADGSESEVDGADFVVEAATGSITFRAAGAPGAFPPPPASARVTYTAGFATVPETLVEAAAHLAAWLHGRAAREEGVSSERLGDYAKTFAVDAAALPGVVRSLLAPYRNVRV